MREIRQTIFIIFTICVVLIFTFTTGLRCYECDNCPAPDDTDLEDCPETAKSGKPQCGTAREDNTVRRFCAYHTPSDNCTGFTCFCDDKDGCNEADYSKPIPPEKGVECYNCTDCNTVSSSTPLVACPTGVCFKIIGENDQVLQRSCYRNKFQIAECRDGICICKGNKCNAAAGLTPRTVLLSFAIILGIISIGLSDGFND